MEKYTLKQALDLYRQILDGGRIPDKAEEVLCSYLSEGDKENFRKQIHGKPSVSASRHPDGRRNWKYINSNRKSAIAAQQVGVTRYQVELCRTLRKFCTSPEQYDDLFKQVMAGTIKISDAIKKAESGFLEQLDTEARRFYLYAKAVKRIKSQWKCILVHCFI